MKGCSGSRTIISALATLGVLLSPSLWAAGSLAVQPSAAHGGEWGLAVTVGSTCGSSEYQALSDQTVSGPATFEACYSITAGDDFVVAGGGDATFTAGRVIALGNGFSVQAGGSFVAALDPAWNPFAFVQDDTPAAETTYNTEFYLDLDGLSLGAAAELESFVAYANGDVPQLRLVIESGPVLVLQVREDGGSFQTTAGVAVTSGWNKVALTWQAAAAATASLAVNDGVPAELTGLATTGRRIDLVRWGAVGGTVDGSAGTILQDDFISTR